MSLWFVPLERQGTRAVFSARLLPLARTFVSLPAGARRVPLGPFVVLTTIGCALWAVAFVLTGLLVGAAWGAVSSVLGRALLVVGLATIALSVIGSRGRGHRNRGRASRRAPTRV